MSSSEANEFGRSLRAARERSGLGLQEISERTKISVGILKSLESGDVSALPGGLFSRSFVRAYASEVGLDPEASVEAFLTAFPDRRPDGPEGGHEAPDASRRNADTGDVTTVAVRLALMSIPVVALLFFFGLRGGPDPEGNVAGSPAAEGDVSSAPREATTTEPLTIEIHPTGPCWVSLMVDGEEVMAGVILANQRRVFEARERFVLSVGDAGIFDFSIDQQPGRSLGVDGEMVTVVIDRDNVHSFVSP